MRFAAFISGLVSLFLLAGVAYWIFITMQYPAGPVNVLVVRTALSWIPQGVLWLLVASLALALVATLLSWRPRTAWLCFAASSICWAVVFVVFSSGMLTKMLGTLAPGTGPVSLLFNLLLVASPLLPLISGLYLSGQARRLRLASQ
jgi:hypothetical protein